MSSLWLGSAEVHPIVRINYRVRGPAFFTIVFLAPTVFLTGEASLYQWAVVYAISLGWAPLAYAFAASRRSRAAQKKAELLNLYGDAIALGLSIAMMALDPWILVASIAIIIPAAAIVGGVAMALLTLVISGVIGVATATLTGIGIDTDSHVTTMIASIVCVGGYTLVLALTQRSVTRTAISRGKQLKAQSAQLATANAAAEEARQSADEARRAAEGANATKSQFLANMSHELRTPLNAIIGYSEMLAEDAEDEGADDLVPDLMKIRNAGKHLLGLINDVLDLSKVEAGKMDIHAERFDVEEMIESVLATVQPLMQKNGNGLVVETEGLPETIRSDQMKVRQILLNLLSNASKFTSEGTVTLSGTVEGVGRTAAVVFRVADTGIGMSPEQVAKLFQPFVQADASTTRKYGGTGLGLTISRRFAQLLGGDVGVDSVAGEGTTFTVRLALDASIPGPSAALAGESEASRSEPAVLGTAPLVLVIDDDASSREILAQTLRRSGFRTAEAADGEAGLLRARELHPALITLDMLMPSLDGWAVLRMLKADPATASIPVVIATITDDRALGYALGAVGYLTKPFERGDLVRTVRTYLRETPSEAATGSVAPVLVVEDDRPTRELLVRGLEREGLAVCGAATAGDALAALRAQRPALVLLDLLLPDGTGFDVLDALDGEGLPVVILTAKDLSADERRRLNGHVERVFQKGRAAPFDVLAEVVRLLPDSSTTAA